MSKLQKFIGLNILSFLPIFIGILIAMGHWLKYSM